jgi:hypothetical protein
LSGYDSRTLALREKHIFEVSAQKISVLSKYEKAVENNVIMRRFKMA